MTYGAMIGVGDHARHTDSSWQLAVAPTMRRVTQSVAEIFRHLGRTTKAQVAG